MADRDYATMKERMKRIVIRSLDDLRLVNVSSVDDFALELRPVGSTRGDDALLAFACDEKDGPVKVYIGTPRLSLELDLAALRELLGRAEADLLRRRSEWREPEDQS